MTGRPLTITYAGPARADIDAIYSYIAKDNQQAARDVAAAIERAVENLALFPRKSLHTVRRRTRAVILGRYPYIDFFKIRRGELEVLHVLHAAQRHPGFQEPAFAFAR